MRPCLIPSWLRSPSCLTTCHQTLSTDTIAFFRMEATTLPRGSTQPTKRRSSCASRKRQKLSSDDAMRLPRIDQAIQECEEHLTRTNALGTVIEAHLTRAMLVLACAVFEETVETLIQERASTLPEPCMQAFFRSCVGAVFRSTRSTELAGLLSRFGSEFKESFNRRLQGHEKAVTFYNNQYHPVVV